MFQTTNQNLMPPRYFHIFPPATAWASVAAVHLIGVLVEVNSAVAPPGPVLSWRWIRDGLWMLWALDIYMKNKKKHWFHHTSPYFTMLNTTNTGDDLYISLLCFGWNKRRSCNPPWSCPGPVTPVKTPPEIARIRWSQTPLALQNSPLAVTNTGSSFSARSLHLLYGYSVDKKYV